MTHFTSITYQMKREILSFSNKISRHLSSPDKKFSADMTYGILTSKSESLGLVRDDSGSSDSKNVYEKGYHVTEACVMAKSGHPVSIFSQIHSSKENHFNDSALGFI